MSQLKAFQDKLLTNVSSMVHPVGLLAEKILPKIESKNFTGKLGKYGTNHLRIENTVVGGRGKFRRVEAITRSTDTFSIEGHGLEGMVTKEDYANVEDPFDAEKDETVGVSTLLLVEKEKGLADTLTSTSVLTNNVTLSGTNRFSDYTNSDPIGVFASARSAIRSACGSVPNLAVMDWAVWNVLRFHPDLLDALGFKDNRPGGLTYQEMASALDVKEIMVAEGVYESAAEGQTSSLAPIWGKDIVLMVAPKTAVPMQTSIGYRVQLAGEQPRKVTKWDVNNPDGAKAILVSDYYDMLISNAGAGYLIKSAIA